MVYLADSLALTVLETLVHLDATATEEPFTAIEFSMPDEFLGAVHPLPADWQQDINFTRQLGSQWLSRGKDLALRVPSALVPAGANLLMNPAHASAKHVKELRKLAFRWDTRLF